MNDPETIATFAAESATAAVQFAVEGEPVDAAGYAQEAALFFDETKAIP
jgi:hypothetical protein